MVMKRWGFIFCAALFSFTLARAADDAATAEQFKIDGNDVKLARYAKSYIGAGNVRVDVAPYKTAGSAEGAILLFHGVESEWDGKAINHRSHSDSNGGVTYSTTYNGKAWNTLISRQDDEGAVKWLLFVPGVKDQITLVPSDGAAQLTNPRAIFQEYQTEQNQKN